MKKEGERKRLIKKLSRTNGYRLSFGGYGNVLKLDTLKLDSFIIL